MTVKLSKIRKNLLEEMNPQWNAIVSKNTCFQQIFMGTEKKSKEILFSMVKEYGRHEISSIQVLIFVSVSVVVFLTSIFLFRGLSIISSVRYFFLEAYPFKNICQTEIFVIVCLPKECLLNK